MFNDLLGSIFVGIVFFTIGSVLLTLTVLITKKKLFYTLGFFVLALILSPLASLTSNNYFYPKYNYTIIATDDSDLEVQRKEKGGSVLLPLGIKNIELIYSPLFYSVSFDFSKTGMDEFLSIWKLKSNLHKVENMTITEKLILYRKN